MEIEYTWLSSGCQGLRRGWGQERSICGYGRATCESLVVGSAPCLLDGISVNILVMILHYHFARCQRWGKLGKRYVGSLYAVSHYCI